jgi:glycosyltransferase involved in cell wall biosynthesis
MQIRPQKLEFLVFSDDWGEHPSSCQHIFRLIAREHRVLWVNTIGMRNPTWTLRDAGKAIGKVGKMLCISKRTEHGVERDVNISVCQPVMLPGVRSQWVRRFNAHSVTKRVRALMRERQFARPIVVTTVPNAVDYRDLIIDRRVIYYCVDDFSLWPGLDAQSVQEMEARLIARADRIIAASDILAQRFKEMDKSLDVITHGVDIDLFATAVSREHQRIQHIQKPRVGFFGLIDGRLDWELLLPLARQMPDTSFVFAGPVDASAGELPVNNNIHFIGPVGYRELPEFISGMNALILPYKTGALAKVLSPLKLKEYVATGKPVMCSSIEAVREWEDVLEIGSTLDEWQRVLRGVAKSTTLKRNSEIRKRLQAESWSSKAREFLRICMESTDGMAERAVGSFK